MTQASLALIIVRAEPAASATSEKARKLGLETFICPLFALKAVDWQCPEPNRFDALMLTSANAVRMAGPQLRQLAHLPAFAVGEATAQAAHNAGLTIEKPAIAPKTHAAPTAQSLIDHIAATGKRRIVWLCAREQTIVKASRVELHSLVCYRADRLEPPSAWQKIIAQPAAMAFFSARAARYARILCGESRSHLVALAMSPAVADAAGEGWREYAVAAQSNEQALLELAARLCKIEK